MRTFAFELSLDSISRLELRHRIPWIVNDAEVGVEADPPGWRWWIGMKELVAFHDPADSGVNRLPRELDTNG
jgi:hypothetical protein